MTSETAGSETTQRVLLAVGTANYSHGEAFGGLPKVPQSLATVVECLRQCGFVTTASDTLADVRDRMRAVGAEDMIALGDPPGFLLDPDRDLLKHELTIAGESAPVVIVYYTGHGRKTDQEPYFLITTDADPTSLPSLLDSALPATELPLRLVSTDPESGQPTVLVILDCCFSGHGGRATLDAALDDLGNPNVWVLASAGSSQWAREGVFAAALADALEHPTWGVLTPHVPLMSLLDAIRDRLPPDTDQRAEVFPPGGRFTGTPPFFPNLEYDPRLAGLAVADQQHWLSRVSGGPEQTDGFYLTGRTGRVDAVSNLAKWITDPTMTGLAVVTGSPGSGKSTVLALPVLMSTAEGRHAMQGSADAAEQAGTDLAAAIAPQLTSASNLVVGIHARGLATDQVAQQVARAIGLQADTTTGLLEQLEQWEQPANASSPMTVLVDAVDEATSPVTLMGSLLLPLVSHGVKIGIGARRHVLTSATQIAELVIDLDEPAYQDPEALTHYVAELLVAVHEPDLKTPYQRLEEEVVEHVAAGMAARATAAMPDGRKAESFLLGRLLATAVRGRDTTVDPTEPDWLIQLPDTVGEAFDEDLARLGAKEPVARRLLSALAWARGSGLPWENIWIPVARTLAGTEDQGAHIDQLLGDARAGESTVRWLLAACGSYVVADVAGGRTVYRLFHDLLAQHLRDEPSGDTEAVDSAAIQARAKEVHGAITRALIDTVPTDLDGQRRWDQAHPYLHAHLAEHAWLAGPGAFSQLLRHPDYLAVADPATLTPLLLARTAGNPITSDLARIYLRARPLLDTGVGDNKAYLQEAGSAIAGSSETHATLSRGPMKATYRTVFSAAPPDDSLLTLVGHEFSVESVAVGAGPDGNPMLASGGSDGTVRLWDPLTGTTVGDPLTAHSGRVTSVAFGIGPSGTALLACAGDGSTVRIWDPMSGTPRVDLSTGHDGPVGAVVFGTGADGTLLLATAGYEGAVRLWDPITGNPRGDPRTGYHGPVSVLAFGAGEDDTLLLAYAGTDGTVQLWDPDARTSPGELRTGLADSWVTSVAFGADSNGAPLLASARNDGTIQCWDLTTCTPHGGPYGSTDPGYHPAVTSVAFGTGPGGAPLLASAGNDGTVRLWDPVTGTPYGDPLMGHDDAVNEVTFCTGPDAAPLLASAGFDGTVRLWDPAAVSAHRTTVSDALTKHIRSVVAVAFGTGTGGAPLLASAGSDGTIQCWDPTTGTPQGVPYGSTDPGYHPPVNAVAFGTRPGGAPLLASGGTDGTVRLWDPVTGTPHGDPLTDHNGPVRAVAFGTGPDGAPVLASAGFDGTVRLWDPITGTPHSNPLTGDSWVHAVAFGTGPGGALLACAGDDGTVRLWDAATGIPHGEPLTGHDGTVNTLAFGTGPDGTPLLASAGDDGIVLLWDLRTGTAHGDPLTGHTGSVNTVAFGTGPNGDPLLVSAGGTVRLWDLKTKNQVALIRRRVRPWNVAVRAGSLEVAVAGGGDGLVLIQPRLASHAA